MKQRIKLVSIVVPIAVLAGALVYELTMGMDRLADYYSLFPVAKNLAPLAVLIVIWLIGSSSVKYFERRRKYRNVPPSETGSSMRDIEEERRQAWLRIKAKGKKRYIWRTGVIGWGLSVFAIFTPSMLIFGPKTHQLSIAEIVGTTILSFFIWMIGGYFFGLWMWKTFDRKYH